jgi:hypothetical protein
MVFLGLCLCLGQQAYFHEAQGSNKQQLIPPPPPVVPSGGQYIFVPSKGGYGSVDFSLSTHDLEQKCKLAEEGAKEQEQKSQEAQEQAQSFESLYKEGVISKKELEAAQRAAVEAKQEASESSQTALSYKQELAARNASQRLSSARKLNNAAKSTKLGGTSGKK